MTKSKSASPELHSGRPIAEIVRTARRQQADWAATPLAGRLGVVRRFRHLLARESVPMAAALPQTLSRTGGESLAAEVLPLADACRFLEREAGRLLRPQRLGRTGRPVWLTGVASEILREPLGVILVVGPGNYPLLLPGVQAIQALTAGNAVLVKPAPGCGAVMEAMRDLLIRAGLGSGLLQVLGESVADAEAALSGGIDKVVLTGSAATGRAVMQRLAEGLIPAVMELSGNDAMLVLPGADPEIVADALAFGLRFNGSRTCLAPRRVFATPASYDRLRQALRERLQHLKPFDLSAPERAVLQSLATEAAAAGAEILTGASGATAVAGPPADSPLLTDDLFVPILALVPVADMEEALARVRESPYALGASLFGPEDAARELAGRLDVGSVCINDLIVPTADPRLPFGGRHRSGFGSTRGAEGLLEMTAPKAISVRRGRLRPHFRPMRPGDEALFAAYLRLAHGGSWTERTAALRDLARAALRR